MAPPVFLVVDEDMTMDLDRNAAAMARDQLFAEALTRFDHLCSCLGGAE